MALWLLQTQLLGLLAGHCCAGGSCGVILEFPGEPYKCKKFLFLLLVSRKKQRSRKREKPLWACQSSAMFTGGPAFTVFEATCKWRMKSCNTRGWASKEQQRNRRQRLSYDWLFLQGDYKSNKHAPSLRNLYTSNTIIYANTELKTFACHQHLKTN